MTWSFFQARRREVFTQRLMRRHPQNFQFLVKKRNLHSLLFSTDARLSRRSGQERRLCDRRQKTRDCLQVSLHPEKKQTADTQKTKEKQRTQEREKRRRKTEKREKKTKPQERETEELQQKERDWKREEKEKEKKHKEKQLDIQQRKTLWERHQQREEQERREKSGEERGAERDLHFQSTKTAEDIDGSSL
ncbi:UNVERIFIED_CONTAM: hypothetical protein HHA_462200 [Hammondia hammondi]|eukprot:XP_008884535.1 hypothetical protein HHA_462200 [Hammondia hammondi]